MKFHLALELTSIEKQGETKSQNYSGGCLIGARSWHGTTSTHIERLFTHDEYSQTIKAGHSSNINQSEIKKSLSSRTLSTQDSSNRRIKSKSLIKLIANVFKINKSSKSPLIPQCSWHDNPSSINKSSNLLIKNENSIRYQESNNSIEHEIGVFNKQHLGFNRTLTTANLVKHQALISTRFDAPLPNVPEGNETLEKDICESARSFKFPRNISQLKSISLTRFTKSKSYSSMDENSSYKWVKKPGDVSPLITRVSWHGTSSSGTYKPIKKHKGLRRSSCDDRFFQDHHALLTSSCPSIRPEVSDVMIYEDNDDRTSWRYQLSPPSKGDKEASVSRTKREKRRRSSLNVPSHLQKRSSLKSSSETVIPSISWHGNLNNRQGRDNLIKAVSWHGQPDAGFKNTLENKCKGATTLDSLHTKPSSTSFSTLSISSDFTGGNANCIPLGISRRDCDTELATSLFRFAEISGRIHEIHDFTRP